MSDAGVFVAAALVWAAFGYKLHHLHHLRHRSSDADADADGAQALRALVILLGLLGGVFTLLPSAVGTAIDGVAGISGIGRLAANLLAMATCLAVLAWLLYLSRPAPEARAHLVVHGRILAVFVAAVLMLFAVDHPPVTPDREFGGAHMYLVLAYLAYAEVGLVLLSWRYAAMVEAPLLRIGLRTVAVANVVGLLWVLTEVSYQVEADLRVGFVGPPAVSRSLYTAAAILFVVGMTLPAWGPWIGLESLWWRVTRRRATRRLRLLWTTVTRACPGVVLDRELLAASPVGERLAAERLPVEIYDAWFVLRYYLDAADVELIDGRATRLGADRDALVAAARVAVAVHRKDTAIGPPSRPVPVIEQFGRGTNRTLVAEVRFLCAVSDALRSRFVRDVLAASRPRPVARMPEVAG